MRRAVASLAAAVAGVIACSSSSDPTTPSDGGAAEASGQVSFSKGVVPILAARCATSSCHGNPDANVGVHMRTDDVAALHAELQKESPTAKGARFVVAGDPAKSFLYAKIEGAQDDSSSCVVPGCGETMPPGTKLGGEQRATIRTWIEQGAKND